MKKYAIREVGTDKYMPEKRAGKNFGYSNDVPQVDGGEFGPRLLPSKKSASLVISNWRQGAWYLDRSGSYDDYEEELTVIPKPERLDVELEVAEFDLVEVFK